MHANATNIAALVNAGWLLALNIWIAVAATRRLMSASQKCRAAGAELAPSPQW